MSYGRREWRLRDVQYALYGIAFQLAFVAVISFVFDLNISVPSDRWPWIKR